MPNNAKVLSIDPGYERLGIAVLVRDGSKEKLLYSDCFRTSAKLPFPERLKLIGEEIERVITAHTPSVLALERLFFNHNQTTAFQVAEVRGALIYLAKCHALEIVEFTPAEVKAASTSYGKSDKKQVAFMLEKLLSIEKKIQFDDEYDAIAVGLCALSRART